MRFLAILVILAIAPTAFQRPLSESNEQAVANANLVSSLETTNAPVQSSPTDGYSNGGEEYDETPTKTRKFITSPGGTTAKLVANTRVPDWLDFFPTSTPISGYFPDGAEAEVALSAQTAFPDHRNIATVGSANFSLFLILSSLGSCFLGFSDQTAW